MSTYSYLCDSAEPWMNNGLLSAEGEALSLCTSIIVGLFADHGAFSQQMNRRSLRCVVVTTKTLQQNSVCSVFFTRRETVAWIELQSHDDVWKRTIQHYSYSHCFMHLLPTGHSGHTQQWYANKVSTEIFTSFCFFLFTLWTIIVLMLVLV